MRENQAAYNSEAVIRQYRQMHDLQRPERAIIKETEERLRACRLLDIGVGAGRTTPHFGGDAAYYLGIDSAPQMIQACTENDHYQRDTYHFRVMDAVNMLELDEAPFDYALFSYNGIDMVNNSERRIIFNNLKKMLKHDGCLVFSSHNILSLNDLFCSHRYDTSMSLLRNIYWLLKERYYRRLFEQQYPLWPPDTDFKLIHDGSINFKTITYYVRPSFQIRQLQEHGFHSIRAFSLSGAEIMLKDLDLITDPWVYFLCFNA